MSGLKITLEIGHSCRDQNTNYFLLLSAKHENMDSLKLYQELKDSPNCLASFLPKTAEFCICLKCQKVGLVQKYNPSVPCHFWHPSSQAQGGWCRMKARHSTD